MIPPQTLVKAIVSRFLPQPTTASGPEADKALRAGPYGDLKVESAWPTDHLLADEGAYMVAAMAPAATALNWGIFASYVATTANIVLYNSAPAGGPNLYPKFVRMSINTAPASATCWNYTVVLDGINRTPTTVTTPAGQSGPGSAGTNSAYKVPVACTNMNVNPPIAGQAFFAQQSATTQTGPATVPAASNAARVIVGNGVIKPSIPVALDQYVLQFGEADRGGTFQAAAALAKIVEHAPPVVVGPGQSLLIYFWGTSNAANGAVINDLALEWVER